MNNMNKAIHAIYKRTFIPALKKIREVWHKTFCKRANSFYDLIKIPDSNLIAVEEICVRCGNSEIIEYWEK